MDDAQLKERLIGYFYADQGDPWKSFDNFKDSAAVTDEQLHRVLMNLFREAEVKLSALTPRSEERSYYKVVADGVIRWLPKCGEIPVKDFLLDYAASDKNDSWLRRTAILSYLRVADAGEAKDALLRFLVDEDRMNSMERLSIYAYARMAYEEAPAEKRTAILAALMAAAAKEEDKIEFMKVDRILAERSAAYRLSRERLALLERHSLEPPTDNLYTDRDLQSALTEARKYRQHTSINTNLAVLESTDFALPLSDLPADVAAETVRGRAGPEAQTAEAAGRGLGRYTVFGLPALFLLGFGAWRLMRR